MKPLFLGLLLSCTCLGFAQAPSPAGLASKPGIAQVVSEFETAYAKTSDLGDHLDLVRTFALGIDSAGNHEGLTNQIKARFIAETLKAKLEVNVRAGALMVLKIPPHLYDHEMAAQVWSPALMREIMERPETSGDPRFATRAKPPSEAMTKAAQEFDAAFTAATNAEGRSAAVRAFCFAVHSAGEKDNWDKTQKARFMTATLKPRLEANLGEAFKLAAAIPPDVYDYSVARSTWGSDVMNAIQSGAKAVTDNFEAEQKKKFNPTPTPPVAAAKPATPLPPLVAGAQDFMQGLTAYTARDYPKAFELWKRAAEAGHPSAMTSVAVMHERGLGTPVDMVAAHTWTEKAAAKGDVSAMFNLGLDYYRGQGVKVDLAQTVAWWEKAAAKNHKKATELLPEMRGQLAYGKQDYATARSIWEKTAATGDGTSMFNIGNLYLKGEGVEEDPAQAIVWYEKAKAAGIKEAPDAIASAQGRAAGREEFKKAVAEYDAKNYLVAVSWYEKAAEKGNVSAMVVLGTLYQFPVGAIEKDRVKARAWFQKAADKGDALAKFSLQELEEGAGMDAFLDSFKPKNDVKSTGTSLVKGSKWTADQILAALKSGANHADLALAIKTDGTEYYVGDYYRILAAPEAATIISHGNLSMALAGGFRPGAGPWTGEQARAAIAQRRKQIPAATLAAETPELRAKAQAGDPAASLALFYALTKKYGDKPWPKEEIGYAQLKANAAKNNYAPGQWILGEGENNKPQAEKDPLLIAEYYRRSAEAGDPMGAYKFAGLFASDDAGVRQNFVEAEYWLIEAAARAPENFFPSYHNVEFDLSMLYSMHIPNGHLPMGMAYYQPATLRWARELSRRGGPFTDFVKVTLAYYQREARDGNQKDRDIPGRLAALPPELPPISPAELTKLEAAAQRGDIAALLKLGDAYATGRGLHQNDARAVDYYRKAAEKNSAPAARALADNYAKGYAVKKDPAQRLAWLKKAGEAGDASAWREFADFQHYSYSNEGMVQNYPVALAAYDKAIAGGDAPALNNLGMMHRYGRGVPKDEAKADALIAKSAQGGYNYAQLDFAKALANKNDFKTAAVWFQKALDGGLPEARHGLASSLAGSGDTEGAKRWLLELAEEKSTEAQSELAKLLEVTGDLAGALKWYRALSVNPIAYDFIQNDAAAAAKRIEEKLNPQPGSIPALRQQAEAGDVNAMLQLAQKLAPTDRPGALVWVKKAADQGNAQAMLTLGLETAATDKPAALALIQKSADAGNLDAKFRMGTLLFQGKEMPQDQTRGLALLMEAADGGFAPAQFELGRAMILGGPGIPANPAGGIALLEKAAAQKMAQAFAVLGEIYERGAGLVAANPAKALRHYQDAQKLGVQQVSPAIQRLQLQLSGKTRPAPAATSAPVKP